MKKNYLFNVLMVLLLTLCFGLQSCGGDDDDNYENNEGENTEISGNLVINDDSNTVNIDYDKPTGVGNSFSASGAYSSWNNDENSPVTTSLYLETKEPLTGTTNGYLFAVHLNTTFKQLKEKSKVDRVIYAGGISIGNSYNQFISGEVWIKDFKEANYDKQILGSITLEFKNVIMKNTSKQSLTINGTIKLPVRYWGN